MRKALIVGIDYYEKVLPLHGCVADAHSVKAVLQRHGDNTVNFDCRVLIGDGPCSPVTRRKLTDSATELFKSTADVALFYFAGHGCIDSTGGYLCTSDIDYGDEGLPLDKVVEMANASTSKNKIIILDSCHSGIAGNLACSRGVASLSEGLTILTASSAEQYATEAEGRGVFTTLLVDALNGGAATLTGDITPGGIYAHIDQSLGAWDQRPIFKTNVREFVSLRRISPPIELDELRAMTKFFPASNFEYHLDPSFEPEMKGRDPGMPLPNPENTKIFSVLQKFNRLNLLVPVGAPHMWHAAMQSKSCKLTLLGEHYWRLVKKDRI